VRAHAQASTLGSLEALLTFLASADVNIPVSGINIGPVHKKDVLRANVMNEKGECGCERVRAAAVTIARKPGMPAGHLAGFWPCAVCPALSCWHRAVRGCAQGPTHPQRGPEANDEAAARLHACTEQSKHDEAHTE